MANGLLGELRRLAESSKDIPQEAINRLILSSLAEIVDRLEKVTISENDYKVSMDDLKDKIDEMDKKLTSISTEIAVIKSNPFISIGSFIKRHPKTSLFMGVLLVAALIVLFTSKAFVILLLTLVGLPNDAITQLIQLVYH